MAWDRAIAKLQEALAKSPDDERLLLKLGDCCRKAGRIDEARKAYLRSAARYAALGRDRPAEVIREIARAL